VKIIPKYYVAFSRPIEHHEVPETVRELTKPIPTTVEELSQRIEPGPASSAPSRPAPPLMVESNRCVGSNQLTRSQSESSRGWGFETRSDLSRDGTELSRDGSLTPRTGRRGFGSFSDLGPRVVSLPPRPSHSFR